MNHVINVHCYILTRDRNLNETRTSLVAVSFSFSHINLIDYFGWPELRSFFFFSFYKELLTLKKKTIHNLDIVLNNDIDDFTNLKFNSNHFASYQNYNQSINLFQFIIKKIN